MPKVTTEYARPTAREERDMLMFKYDINVNTQGVFTTTLPADAVEKLEALGIDLKRNTDRRNSRPGYIEAPTMEELKKAVTRLVDQAVSRELVTERLVIKYGVSTNCHYIKHMDGTIYPNGQYCPGEHDEGRAEWVDGTEGHNPFDPKPYSMKVYAQPFIERVYKYFNGTTKTTYSRINQSPTDGAEHLNPGPNLIFLDRLVKCGPQGMSTQVIEYTEPIALFFVKFIKMIMDFSDKIKDFLDPESVKAIAYAGIAGFLEGTNKTEPGTDTDSK